MLHTSVCMVVRLVRDLRAAGLYEEAMLLDTFLASASQRLEGIDPAICTGTTGRNATKRA